MEYRARELLHCVLDELIEAYNSHTQTALQTGFASALHRDQLEETYWQSYSDSMSRWTIDSDVAASTSASFGSHINTGSVASGLLPSLFSKISKVSIPGIGQGAKGKIRLEQEIRRIEGELMPPIVIDIEYSQSSDNEPAGPRNASERPRSLQSVESEAETGGDQSLGRLPTDFAPAGRSSLAETGKVRSWDANPNGW